MIRIQALVGVFGVVLSGCASDDSPAPSPGSMRVTVTTTTFGPNLDADGYYLTVGSNPPQRIGTSADMTMTDLEPGDYSVLLSDLAPACWADSTLTVAVQSAETAQAAIAVQCGINCDPLGADCLRVPESAYSEGAPLRTMQTSHRPPPARSAAGLRSSDRAERRLRLTGMVVGAIYPRL